MPPSAPSKDGVADEWAHWGRARAQEKWARCVRCLKVPPLDGKYYCVTCLTLPPMIWRIQTWNGFWGRPNPLPWKMLKVPYDTDGMWEEWIEPEYWTRPTRWQAWKNRMKMRLNWFNWYQPGWNDERPD